MPIGNLIAAVINAVTFVVSPVAALLDGLLSSVLAGLGNI